MAAIIDTSRYVKIPYHRGKLAKWAVVCGLFVVAGAWMALGIGPRHSAFNQFMGCLTVALFGWLSATFLRRALRLGTYLTLSPKGFRVAQSSSDLIAWSGVTAVVERRLKLSRYLLLSLTPEAAAQIAVPPLARLFGQRKPSPSLSVSAQASAVSYDELTRLVQAFFVAHGSHSGATTNPSDPSSRPVRQS